MFALSLYTVTYKFTLPLIAHKGKYKGKYIRLEHKTGKKP